jgi:cysteine desulfurase
MNKVQADMLSLSGHKIHAPKGIGALYIRKGTKFSPFLIGGHQESGRRGGTENVASIVGLGKASEMALADLDKMSTRIKKLRDKLENTLVKTVPNTMINGDREQRLPNTTSIGFEYVHHRVQRAPPDLLSRHTFCAQWGFLSRPPTAPFVSA